MTSGPKVTNKVCSTSLHLYFLGPKNVQCTHVGWLFADVDSTLQGLLRTHLILPNILGDVFAEHPDEIAGGRMFALKKANNSWRPNIIGSQTLWRRCAARFGVAEVRSNVATFLCRNTRISFNLAANQMGATRCAQVTQLLAAAWEQHSNENPLVVIQLDIVNAYSSAGQQAQFEVLPGRASKSYDNEHVQIGDAIHCPSSLYHYWSCFESMQGTASTLHFNDYQGQAHKIACSKGGQH